MLELRGVTHRWSDTAGQAQGWIAKDLNWQVSRGETVALLGSSGSGKSTLLRMIAGLEQPQQGDVLWADEVITHLAPERRQFALMFQDFALFSHLSVQDNVAFGLREQGLGKAAARRQAVEALTSMGLANRADASVWSLSGGEQQRVALARAWVTRPKLLLLDEPFSKLDETLRQHIRDWFFAQVLSRQIPAVLVTHDPSDIADREHLIDLVHAG